MRFKSRRSRVAGCCILSVTIILLHGLTVFPQAPQPEHTFTTQDNPRITISNASSISIAPWEKNLVSVAAEVSGAPIQLDEVRIKPEKNRLDITCNPIKPDRNIFLTLRVPAKANLEIKSHSNKIEVMDPAGQVSVIVSNDSIQLNQIQSDLTQVATKQLRSLADASGARFYHANRIADLKGVFEQVAAELRTVYSMAYTPTNLRYDGSFRKIRVQVNTADVVARTRPGYDGR